MASAMNGRANLNYIIIDGLLIKLKYYTDLINLNIHSVVPPSFLPIPSGILEPLGVMFKHT